jgi:hypothetical protein
VLTLGLEFNEIEHGLIIDIGDVIECDLLLLIHRLLELECVIVEVLLEFLISKVDLFSARTREDRTRQKDDDSGK